MIRHSSSFFISIVIHLVLLLGAYFAWNSYSETKEEYKKESVSLQLCKVKYEKETLNQKKEPKKIEQPKKPVEPKIQKKIAEAPKPKPELKPIPKPIPPKKEIAVEKAVPKVQEVQKSKVVEEVKTEEEKVQDLLPRAPKIVETEPKKEVAEPKSQQSRHVDATEKYLKVNTQKISELIRENLYYPMAARKRNITGRVSIKFTLCSNGEVNDIKIIDSSSDILSRAAIRTIKELSGKFPKSGVNITLTLPIDYSLN